MASACPPYLRDLLREGCTRDDWVHRRCRRYLETVWHGLRGYVGVELRSAAEWEEHVRPATLQRWYVRWLRTATDATPRDRRWLRYTLNRLVASLSPAPTRIRGADARGAQPGAVRPTQAQERVVETLLAHLPDPTCAAHRSARYALRRFIVGGPYYEATAVRSVPQAEVEWWLRDRRPLVVPLARWEACERHLWSVLRSLGPLSLGTPASARRSGTPLLCDAAVDDLDPTTVPLGCQAFFRHWFARDEVDYLRRMQRRLRTTIRTPVHTGQVWDAVRACWTALTHDAPGACMRTVVDDPATPAGVWTWLLTVHRRQGGGGDRMVQLPTVCVRALAAARAVWAEAGWNGDDPRHAPGLPTRRAYVARVQAAAVRDEPLSLPPAPGPGARSGRTYSDAECERLRAASTGHRDYCLILLLQRVGLRNAAVRHLLWRDVTAPEPPHAPLAVGSAPEKGGVRRAFGLAGDPALADALVRHLAETRATVLAWEWETAYVFPRSHTEATTPMTPGQIHYWFRALAERADVRGPHVTLHHFRHYIVTRLMDIQGNRPLDVSLYMGHRRLTTTVDWYWHCDPLALEQRLHLPWRTATSP